VTEKGKHGFERFPKSFILGGQEKYMSFPACTFHLPRESSKKLGKVWNL
jgi:hypothetical protein